MMVLDCSFHVGGQAGARASERGNSDRLRTAASIRCSGVASASWAPRRGGPGMRFYPVTVCAACARVLSAARLFVFVSQAWLRLH